MSGMGLGERAVRLALRCYPRWWRDRYGPDQEALVEDLQAEQGRRTWLASGAWRLAGSFVVGAVRARSSGFGMPAGPELWQRRARAAIIAGTIPAALAAPAAVLLALHTGEYGRGPASAVMRLSAAGRVAQWESLSLALLSLAFIVQLVLGAARLSFEMGSLAPPRRRVLVAAATLAPVVAVGLGFLLFHEASSLRPVISGGEMIGDRVVQVRYSYRGHPLAAAILFWAGWTGVLGGWVGGALMLARMAARRRFPLRSLMAGVKHARAVTLLQGGVALCVLALAITLPLQPPIAPDGGMTYRSDLGPWTPVVSAALLATALITWAATRAARQAITRATLITWPLKTDEV